jgi:hypothetical protein
LAAHDGADSRSGRSRRRLSAALAVEQRAALVSGDAHMLVLASDYPIAGPADFLATILGASD